MHVHAGFFHTLYAAASALLLLVFLNLLAAKFPNSSLAQTWLALTTGKDL